VKALKIIKLTEASMDVASTLRNYHLFTTLGWQDVATRYRRSRVGAFWLTINMLVMISVLGIVFGSIFGINQADFLPGLAIGLIVWGLASGLISEGCESLFTAKETILQIKMPQTTHIFRVAWRNMIIAGHNFLILPLLFLVFMKPVGFVALLSIIGLSLLVANAVWMMLILAVICTRFRDFSQIVQNAMQVLFYATPIIWTENMLHGKKGEELLVFNPFYHLLCIVREPLLGNLPSATNWLVAVIMAIVGWIIALAFFNRHYKKIPYWL
jgi:homopolymeric O-antigen transport system permease protein